jgi:hypothetical protein
MGDIVSQLLARRGYAQVQSSAGLDAVLQQVLEPALAQQVRVGRLRAGILELYATDSVSLQELSFHHHQLLMAFQSQLPDSKIKRLRCAIG